MGDDVKAGARDEKTVLDSASDGSGPVDVAFPVGASTVGAVVVVAADPSAALATIGANWRGTSEATRRSENTRWSTSRAVRFR
jgi:hypothetical protein